MVQVSSTAGVYICMLFHTINLQSDSTRRCYLTLLEDCQCSTTLKDSITTRSCSYTMSVRAFHLVHYCKCYLYFIMGKLLFPC
jgi:hypothetical protein